jgi:acyl-CoA synthetase (AMP-forming)/AMP-acid ligase II
MPLTQRLSLRDVLVERARQDPDRLAYQYGEEQLTFGDLAARAAERAAALAQSGIKQGDRIALVMTPGMDVIEMFWATQLVGAAPCIFNPSIPHHALKSRVAVIAPHLVVTDEIAVDMAQPPISVTDPEISSDDVAYFQLTSGTSGNPRAAVIHQRHVLAYLDARDNDRDLSRDDVLVNWMPMWHDFGLVAFVIAATYFVASCYMLEPTTAALPDWLATIGAVGGTQTGGPDFAYKLACRLVDPGRVDLSSLRIAWTGAEPVRWPTIQQFEDRFDIPNVMMPAYGLAEATLGVSGHLPGDNGVVDARGNVSCGWPFPGMEVRAGTSVDSPSEILVRSDWVFAGYFQAIDETSEKLRNGWLHTGDTGYLDKEGRLFVLGRRDTMIKRAGSVIAPRELEEAAQTVTGVRIAAAISTERQGRDELIVVVETRELESAESIIELVSSAIHAAMGFSPHRVLVVDPHSIPRSGNGKIRYGLLKSTINEGTFG